MRDETGPDGVWYLSRMKFLLPAALVVASLLAVPAAAQQVNRIDDFNRIGWYVYEGDHALGPRWTIHTEAQVRRVDFISSWQQLLLRGGVGYQVLPRLKLGGGYTYFTTHPYGKHPVADAGTFPEHRFYEDVTLSDTLGRFPLAQRVRLEQRYVGVPGASGPLSNSDVWQRQNRIRYQLAVEFPLQGPTLDDQEWYLTGFDEVFLNFGRDITTNVFNQNRLAGGVGYRFQDNFRLELQFLNQITQHADPDPATKFPVYEFNNGFRLGVSYDLTLIK
jgi:opacity protein-like surface antigen